MDITVYHQLIRAMNDAAVTYVIVGGVAVLLHGRVRTTNDIDLVIALDRENIVRAIDVLQKMGYRPRIPVPAMEFADPSKRAQWVREKGMMVFSWFDPQQPLAMVDIFVEPPLDFDSLFTQSEDRMVEGVRFRVCSLEHLIQMKREAGRHKDLDDLQKLEWLRDAKADDRTVST